MMGKLCSGSQDIGQPSNDFLCSQWLMASCHSSKHAEMAPALNCER